MFNSSTEVFTWLDQFINLERGQKPKSFRIDRMHFLCDLAGNPEKCAPSIHVAGSKGKGSVTSMITSILASAGYRPARFMSPHVTDIRERICLGDQFFSEAVYCSAGNELKETIHNLQCIMHNDQTAKSLFDPAEPDGCEPTYFELLTLYFFLCAKHGNCNVIVAETGMGGRLDCTNVLDPLVSVITLIELEHTQYLGETIEKIAGEKAGIIKQNKPLVLAEQCNEALQVFQKTAQEKNSKLIYLLETIKISNLDITASGTTFTLEQQSPATCSLLPAPYSLPIPGKVQAHNAALAITAIKTTFPNITDNQIKTGLAYLKIPARFEKIHDNPPFIIDGAHTPESLELCIETFTSLYGKNGILIFGCAEDKDANAMAQIACPNFSKIIITGIGSFKANDPKKVHDIFTQYGKGKVELVELLEIKKTLCDLCNLCDRRSQKTSARNSLPILATGSFYLVSEIRKLFTPI